MIKLLSTSPYVPYDPAILTDLYGTIKTVVGVCINVGIVLMALIVVVHIIVRLSKIFTKHV